MASVVILGGGIAGLSSGIALAKAGWAVRIYERAGRIEAMGAALSLWPNATEGLRQLGVLDAVHRRGSPIRSMLVADREQRPIIAEREIDGSAYIVTRSDLQSALYEALPAGTLVLGAEASIIEAHAGGVRVRFASGEDAAADLLVDAAGLRSTAADPAAVSYRGYGGVVALSDPVHDGGLNHLAAEYWGWGERFGLFELPGERRYWFYMRDQAADAAPPSADFIRSRAEGWAPAIGRAIMATPPERLVPFSIYARAVPIRLGSGRIVRVGDAAHAMEPNLGQGACQAIEDAVALGAVARTHQPDDVLPAFERLRLKRLSMIVRRAAEGRHGAHGPRLVQWTMRNAFRLIPNSISDRLARSIQTMPDYR